MLIGRVTAIPDRSLFWQAYTPQMFRPRRVRQAPPGRCAGLRRPAYRMRLQQERVGMALELVEGRRGQYQGHSSRRLWTGIARLL